MNLAQMYQDKQSYNLKIRYTRERKSASRFSNLLFIHAYQSTLPEREIYLNEHVVQSNGFNHF